MDDVSFAAMGVSVSGEGEGSGVRLAWLLMGTGMKVRPIVLRDDDADTGERMAAACAASDAGALP